jgi:hypothetical protein
LPPVLLLIRSDYGPETISFGNAMMYAIDIEWKGFDYRVYT